MAGREIDPVLVGRNIAFYRESNKMTQAQLAELLNCTPAFVSRIECGAKKPGLQMLANIAAIFGVSCDAILFGPEEENALDNITSLLHDKPASVVSQAEYMVRAVVQYNETESV